MNDRESRQARALGSILRIHRGEKGLTQAQAADGIGIPLSTLVGYERGHRVATPETLGRIAAFYGLSSTELQEQAGVYQQWLWPDVIPPRPDLVPTSP
jgi:transcriptional regulator with XRE-family HTH domain